MTEPTTDDPQPADLSAIIDIARQKMIEEGAAPSTGDVHPLEALGYHAMGLSYALERAQAERDHLAAAANPADVAVRAIQLMQETGRERDAFSTGLREARTTNQRLNRRTQELESELAAYRRAVAEWQINEQNAYIPLRTIAAIAKAAGLDIPTDRFEMHYQRLERAEAAVARVREYVATSDDDGIRTRENILGIVGDWPGPETAPAAATQAIGGRCSARLAWTGSAKEALLKAEQQQWADAAGLSRADEDEAADVYEEMLRRVESSGPRRPATVPSVAAEQQVTEALRAEISMLCDCCGNNRDRMNRIRQLVGLPAEDYGRGSDEEAEPDD